MKLLILTNNTKHLVQNGIIHPQNGDDPNLYSSMEEQINQVTYLNKESRVHLRQIYNISKLDKRKETFRNQWINRINYYLYKDTHYVQDNRSNRL